MQIITCTYFELHFAHSNNKFVCDNDGMTLQMISCFIILNGMFHLQFHIILYWKQIYKNNRALKIMISSYVWFIIYLNKLILLNHMYESVGTKVNIFNIIQNCGKLK